jgi:hypothetical protein
MCVPSSLFCVLFVCKCILLPPTQFQLNNNNNNNPSRWAELFHGGGTDVQTEMTKLIVAFRKFANAPKMTRQLAVILCFQPMEQSGLNVCEYRRPKLNWSLNNVKRIFKEVCQNMGGPFKTGEKINVSGPVKQKDTSPIPYLRK